MRLKLANEDFFAHFVPGLLFVVGMIYILRSEQTVSGYLDSITNSQGSLESAGLVGIFFASLLVFLASYIAGHTIHLFSIATVEKTLIGFFGYPSSALLFGKRPRNPFSPPAYSSGLKVGALRILSAFFIFFTGPLYFLNWSKLVDPRSRKIGAGLLKIFEEKVVRFHPDHIKYNKTNESSIFDIAKYHTKYCTDINYHYAHRYYILWIFCRNTAGTIYILLFFLIVKYIILFIDEDNMSNFYFGYGYFLAMFKDIDSADVLFFILSYIFGVSLYIGGFTQFYFNYVKEIILSFIVSQSQEPGRLSDPDETTEIH